MRIAVVASGEMGSAIARRMRLRGAEVLTSLAGRGEASRARAAASGIGIIDDDTALVESVEIFLSVVPPASAGAVAERFAPALARAGGKVLFADCNAIAPAKARAIAKIIEATASPFVDGGIIGGPPKAGDPGPRLYVSGEAAAKLAVLSEFGLDVRAVAGGIGAASALKLSYAALTKGLTALGVAAASGAASEGVSAALAIELAQSQPAMAALLARGMPRMYPKAHRFVGEMEEIARFLDREPAGEIYRGAALAYRHVATAWQAEGADATLFREIGAAFPGTQRAERAA
ncbi:MAG: DUF1932 domain-containing protein [Acetobacteraceae bacterium]